MKSLKMFLTVALLFLTAMFSPLFAAAAEKMLTAEIAVPDKARATELSGMGLDVIEVKDGAVVIITSASGLETLTERGFECEITSRDADSLFTVARGEAAWVYHTYDQVRSILKETADRHSGICKLRVIGKSCENREIYALNITGGSGGGRPAALITGLHHGREWISVEAALSIVKDLTENYSTDDEVRRLVDRRDIWVVPVVNPDGLVYSQTSAKTWRKNRRSNPDRSYGVDLNRNYGYQWGNVGASDTMTSSTYHGPKAFSEPCSQAIRDLASERRFAGDLSLHSYSGLVLYPYGYSTEAFAADERLLAEMASEIAGFYGYIPRKSADLYAAMGDHSDYMYGAAGSLSFTIELGKGNFTPPATEAVEICAASVRAARYLLERIGTVHASHHPGSVSKVAAAMASYSREASAADAAGNSACDSLVCLFDPAGDEDGKNFEEFIEAVETAEWEKARLFAPALKQTRDMMTARGVPDRGRKDLMALRALARIQAELSRAAAE